jgi:ParB/RepB/Spo0J family partition protein
MNIALAHLDNTIPDLRRVAPSPAADAAMLATIRVRGVLQPILVRPSGNRFEIVLGRRRVRLAREAGLLEIPAEIRAMSDAEAIEAQVMENLQRERLHPIDQWRAAKDMLDTGLTIGQAALALGLTERDARRMELLAGLHPQVLALAERVMPDTKDLATIAAAPLEQQAAALRVPHAVIKRDVNWFAIARACRTDSIPRGRAIFDTEKAAVTWIEDLFAQPGSPEQFVTHDLPGFMAAQRTALETRVAAARRRGERMTAAEWGSREIALPRGWTRSYLDHKRPLKDPAGPCRFVAIDTATTLGAVVEAIASPPPSLRRPDAPREARRPAQTARTAALVSSPGATVQAPESEDEDPQRPGVTQRGAQIIAAAKTKALRDRLRGPGCPRSPELLAAAAVLALGAKNVDVHVRSRFDRAKLDDLALLLVDPAGGLTPPDEMADLLAEILARMLVVTDPVTMHGSGPVAEWIGNAIGADAALPRFDTEEFLATLSAGELRRLAREIDVSMPKLVRDLRKALVGKAPDWRPTTFGAPGPQPSDPERGSPQFEEEFAE